MASRNKKQPEQDRLFDPGPAAEKHDSELTLDEWESKHANNLVYHATFRGNDFQHAPSFHAGTKASATQRLGSTSAVIRHSPWGRSVYYDPSSAEYFEDNDPFEHLTDAERAKGWTHTGRLYAFRLDKNNQSQMFSDKDANTADLIHHVVTHNYHPDDVSRSILASSDEKVREDLESYDHTGYALSRHRERGGSQEPITGARALRDRKVVPYVNDGEDRGSTSVIIPHGTEMRTWEDDVLAPGSKASPGRQAYARQRVENGTKGTVAIPVASVKVAEQLPIPGISIIPKGIRNRPLPIQTLQFRTEYE